MVFVQRDADNKVCAIFEKNDNGLFEELSEDNPDVRDFLVRCVLDKNVTFLRSDLDLIRVMEDLIQILMEKNFISITDFPAPVIEKLIARNKIRTQLQDISGIVDEN